MADTNQEITQETVDRLIEHFRRFGDATQDANNEMRRAEAMRTDELKAAGAASADALGAIASAAMSTGKAMLAGEKGAAAFNSTIDGMATAVSAAGAALTFLVPGGPLVKGIVAGVTAITAATASYAKAANEMGDKLYKGVTGLSKVGGAASDGMTGLYHDAKKLGLSMNELDGFVQLVGENSRDFALFGGTVFEGRKKFADMGKAMEPFRENLFRMGLSQEQINEGAAGYIKLNTQYGRVQQQNAEQLAEGARKYLVEQDALTKLTGLSRKEAEDARDEIRAQEEFAAVLVGLRAEGKLERADELEKLYLIIKDKNPKAAQGLIGLATGNLRLEASRQALLASQGEDKRVVDEILAGTLDAASGAQRVAKAHGETAKRMGPSMGAVNTYGDVFGNLYGDVKLGAAAATDIKKAAEKIAADQKKQGITGDKADDELLDDRAKLLKVQQTANKAMEDFVMKGIGPAQKVAIGLADATTAATNGLMKLFNLTDNKAPGENDGAYTEEEAKAAQPMLDKAAKEREIYASQEFKNWQKEQGANFMQKGMYHEKYGVAAYMKEKGIDASKPEERDTGSFGKTGGLIEDFGKGTLAVLHGKEGVLTEDQLRQFGEQAMQMSQSVTAASPVAMPTAPVAKVSETSKKTQKAEATKLKLEENELSIAEKNYAAVKKQNQTQKELDKEDEHICDEEEEELKKYVTQKDKYYRDMLEFLDTEFATLKETIGGLPGEDGIDVGGGGILAFFGITPEGGPDSVTISGKPNSAAPGAAEAGESPVGSGGGSGGGNEKPDLASITTKSGKTAQVGRHSQQAFQGIVDWLESQGYNIKSIGGYANRDVRGRAGVKSAHARGAAIDINPGENPLGSTLVTDMPEGVGEVADKLGLGWGGNWRSRKDAMHFSSQTNEGGDIIKAASGGMFTGPTTGYPAELHGTEAVIPMDNGPITPEIPDESITAGSTSVVKEEIIGMRDDMRAMITELTQAMSDSAGVDVEEHIITILENIAKHQNVTQDANQKLVRQKANG